MQRYSGYTVFRNRNTPFLKTSLTAFRLVLSHPFRPALSALTALTTVSRRTVLHAGLPLRCDLRPLRCPADVNVKHNTRSCGRYCKVIKLPFVSTSHLTQCITVIKHTQNLAALSVAVYGDKYPTDCSKKVAAPIQSPQVHRHALISLACR